MLDYNEITQRKFIVLDDNPYEVVSSNITRKQQRKPVNQTKLKNLITGRVTEKSFHQSDSIHEAEIENKKIKYLFSNKGEFWFCEKDNPRERFKLPENIVSGKIKYLKENDLVDALVFNLNDKEQIIGIKIPLKVELKVTDAPPAVRGNTAQGVTKQITVENGAVFNAPIFIKEGETIKINTDTGEYSGRVEKQN